MEKTFRNFRSLCSAATKGMMIFGFIIFLSTSLGDIKDVIADDDMAVCKNASYDQNTVTSKLNAAIPDKNVWKGNYKIETIDDLKGLSGYTNITGYLEIKNTSLVNLDGLECLNKIDDGLEIEHNRLLTNIDGLKNLKSVEIIMINDNPALVNLDGLSSLTSVDDLVIVSNDLIKNVNNLSSITHVDNLLINNNDSLINLDGLRNLKKISGDLVIVGNDVLSTLSLSKLKSIGNNLHIYGNDQIGSSLCLNLVKKLVDFKGTVDLTGKI
jgi:hypothetical protein